MKGVAPKSPHLAPPFRGHVKLLRAINASDPRFKAPDIESYLKPCISSRKAKPILNYYCHDHQL